MKKMTAGIFLFAALFTSAVFGGDNITVLINGEELVCETEPLLINGRTMLPVRDIFEAVGAEVSYESETKTVTGLKNGKKIVLTAGSNIIEVNGEKSEMDTALTVVNGITFAPVRYITEALGCAVKWHEGTFGGTVSIIILTDFVSEPEAHIDLSYFTENGSDLESVSLSGMTEEEVKAHITAKSYFPVYLFSDLDLKSEVFKEYLKNGDYEGYCSAVYDCWENYVPNLAGRLSGYVSGDDPASDLFALYSNTDEIIKNCRLGREDNLTAAANKINDDTTLIFAELSDFEGEDISYENTSIYAAALYNSSYEFKYYILSREADGTYVLSEQNTEGYSIITGFSENVSPNLKAAFLYTVCSEYFCQS